jgi:hypothetical protein
MMVETPEGKRPLRTPRHRWEDNIKTDLKDKVWEWIHLVLDRERWRAVVNTIVNFRVP